MTDTQRQVVVGYQEISIYIFYCYYFFYSYNYIIALFFKGFGLRVAERIRVATYIMKL